MSIIFPTNMPSLIKPSIKSSIIWVLSVCGLTIIGVFTAKKVRRVTGGLRDYPSHRLILINVNPAMFVENLPPGFF